jgi:hypothetical protein
LELSRYPSLIVELTTKDALSRESVVALTIEYPPRAKEAAMRLLKLPQALQVMANNMEVTTLLGIIYSHHPEELQRSADRIHEELTQADAQALARWSASLAQNEEALDEFVTAADDAASNGFSTVPRAEQVAIVEQFGFYVDENFQPVFFALPAYGPVIYVLDNADRYPHLADIAVSLWQEHQVHAPFSYAVSDWWRARSHDYTADVLKQDAQRVTRLAEMARFEKQFAAANAPYVSGLRRGEFLRTHMSEFTNIAAFQTERERQDRNGGDELWHDADSDEPTPIKQQRDERLAKARELIHHRESEKKAQRRARIDARRRLSAGQQSARATLNLQRAWDTSRAP